MISKKKKEKFNSWARRKGGVDFDFENKNIILLDGGLFSIEKEIKIKPKTRTVFGQQKEINFNGKSIKCRELKFIPIRRNNKILNEKVEYYKAIIWFEELNETINYLNSMKRMINKLGFETKHKYEKSK